jgi:hypothetical protein
MQRCGDGRPDVHVTVRFNWGPRVGMFVIRVVGVCFGDSLIKSSRFSGRAERKSGNLDTKSAIFDRSLPARRNGAIPIIESLSNSRNALIIRHNVRWYRLMGLLCFGAGANLLSASLSDRREM